MGKGSQKFDDLFGIESIGAFAPLMQDLPLIRDKIDSFGPSLKLLFRQIVHCVDKNGHRQI